MWVPLTIWIYIRFHGILARGWLRPEDNLEVTYGVGRRGGQGTNED